MNPREILNRIKWTETDELEGVEIWYLHRGAPNDTRIIRGTEVSGLGRHYLELENASIPYHRILKIVYRKEVLYERRKP